MTRSDGCGRTHLSLKQLGWQAAKIVFVKNRKTVTHVKREVSVIGTTGFEFAFLIDVDKLVSVARKLHL